MRNGLSYRITGCDEAPDYRYALTVATTAATADGTADATAVAGAAAPDPTLLDLVVVQCNPSRAGASRSDPTVGKVATWAAAEGFATVTFVNLFARRSPRVDAIRDLPYPELVGPRNDAVLARDCAAARVLVFAWGATLPADDAAYARRLHELEALCAGQAVHRVGALVRGRGRVYPRHGRTWNRGNRGLQPLTWRELTANSRKCEP